MKTIYAILFVALCAVAYVSCKTFVHGYNPVAYLLTNVVLSAPVAWFLSRRMRSWWKGLLVCGLSAFVISVVLNIVFYYAGGRDLPEQVAPSLLLPTAIASIAYPALLGAWLPALGLFALFSNRK